MASSLFGKNPTPSPQNNLTGMIQQFQQFQQTMAGQDPKAVVQSLLQSGQMTRQQFDQLSAMANQFQAMFKAK